MKMAVRGELWKKWLQCLSMTVLKQNGSGLMEPVAGCIACKHRQSTGRCCKQDLVNEFLIRQIPQTAFCRFACIFCGYYGQLKCFMDRVFTVAIFPETGCRGL